MYGSLLKREVLDLMEGSQLAEKAIEDLIQDNFLVSARSYIDIEKMGAESKSKNSSKKRQTKEEEKRAHKMKKEEVASVDHDFPICVNMIKFLAEERRQVVLDFAKAKILGNTHHGHEIDWRLL